MPDGPGRDRAWGHSEIFAAPFGLISRLMWTISVTSDAFPSRSRSALRLDPRSGPECRRASGRMLRRMDGALRDASGPFGLASGAAEALRLKSAAVARGVRDDRASVLQRTRSRACSLTRRYVFFIIAAAAAPRSRRARAKERREKSCVPYASAVRECKCAGE